MSAQRLGDCLFSIQLDREVSFIEQALEISFRVTNLLGLHHCGARALVLLVNKKHDSTCVLIPTGEQRSESAITYLDPSIDFA